MKNIEKYRRAFYTSESYYNIALQEREKMFIKKPYIITPYIVNMCFSLEILLKLICIINKKKIKRDHDISDMYNSYLTEDQKTIIKTKFKEYDEKTFKECLAKYEEIYTNARYVSIDALIGKSTEYSVCPGFLDDLYKALKDLIPQEIK